MTVEAAIDDQARRVPISSLTLSLSGEDLECIRVAKRTADLVEVYRSGQGDSLPPVLVRGERTVIDGHHRVLAALATGETHVYATRSLLAAMMPARSAA